MKQEVKIERGKDLFKFSTCLHYRDLIPDAVLEVLDDNNVFDIFIDNMIRYAGSEKAVKRKLDFISTSESVFSYIGRSFLFSATPQGSGFWHKLRDNYRGIPII